MHIKVTNNILNLAELQEKLDRTVFEHIDTAQNWNKADVALTSLHTQMLTYFQSALERKNGEAPKVNPYWILFLNSAAKITYFYYLTKQHTEVLDEQAKDLIVKGYVVASKLLPDNLSEENVELLEEIQTSITQLDDTVKITKVKNQATDCLAILKTYTQQQLS